MKRSGMSVVGIVVALLVAAGVAFVVVYMISAPMRTRTNAAYKNFAEWTPDNIAKDPVNYLNFCEAETQTAIQKLKASEIAIAQKRAQVEGMLQDNQNKVALGQKALDELKGLYKQADAAKQWPMTWRSAALDQDACKRQIVKFAGELRSKSDLIKKLGAATDQLKAQSGKVLEARDKAQEQLTQIATSREMLKVQQITDDLKDNLVAMKSVLQTSVLGVAAAEPGTISLDDLAATSEASVDETEFANIMKE